MIKLRHSIYPILAMVPLAAFSQNKKPNILCITCEDISPRIGCFGDTVAKTPNLDKFAEESVRFTRMFTTVGVSAPSRAALITGMYPTAIGANYMRNNAESQYMPPGIEPYEVVLPEGVKAFTEFLRTEGYYCTNNAKTDYQFASPLTAWDELGTKAHWKNRPKGKPFFSIFNLGITHESKIWENTHHPLAVNPKDIVVPPYLPDNSVTRHDMAVLYTNIFEMDKQFQKIYDELKASGELENTIIIWYSDNGGPLPREKRSIYESGMLVPFMIRLPDGYRAGEIEDRMCMFPDIPATILSLANIHPPVYMQGIPFLGKYSGAERQYVYGARDRMDEQIDKQGSIRNYRYRYVRNYNPEKSNYGANQYRLQMPMMAKMVEWLGVDSLTKDQMRWFAAPRAKEEFYDLVKDPYELYNLIENPTYKTEIDVLRKEFDHWVENYSPNWKLSEAENRKMMYPDGCQPELKKPMVSVTKKGIKLTSEDKGVSFAYQVNDSGYNNNHWLLYDERNPIKLKKNDKLTVISVRAGMKNSEKTEYRK